MILDDGESVTAGGGPRATLDDIFRQAAVRHPKAMALLDSRDRARVADGAPRRLSYAEADRLASALAARLRGLGLPIDTVVATHLPNTVESIVTMLGILRAGMIVAPLPLLWRKADAISALGRVGAKALITSTRIGAVSHGELAIQMASELFAIRQIFAYGNDVPDGVVPLDDLFTTDKQEPPPPVTRAGNPAAHVAAITFDVTGDGIVPVPRNHAQLIAGGLGPLLEGRIALDATMLSATPISSFGGIALTLLPWLLSGGTLALHHPFDLAAFTAQRRALHCDALVVPGSLVAPLVEIGELDDDDLKTVLSLWRAPERLSETARWRGKATLVDVTTFGEIGLTAARRDAGGRFVPFSIGAIGAPRELRNAVPIVEIGRNADGMLALRGPMAPLDAFPPGITSGREPHFKVSADGFVDTGYACRLDADEKTLTITSPPAGIAGVGGYRFITHALDVLMAELAADASLFALPDAFTGQRLAGTAPDRAMVAAKLAERGTNPLVAGAFLPRGPAIAA
ncbi:MAG: AMP-binding protein [Pseudolabrys sp.]|jgi:AMP-binding enzyme